jgi:hypothetical protein
MALKFKDHQTVVVFPAWSEFKIYAIFTDDLAASRIRRYETAGAAGDSSVSALFTRGAGNYGHLFFKPDASAEIITHECWHAIWWMFTWAGVTNWDNETTAYHLGYLVGKVSEFQAKILGVKSNKRGNTDGHKDSQRSLVKLSTMQSRFDRKEKTGSQNIQRSDDFGLNHASASSRRPRRRRVS